MENKKSVTLMATPAKIKKIREEAKVISFVSQEKLAEARKQLTDAGFDGEHYADGELIHAIRLQEKTEAATVVPIIIDWMMRHNVIQTPHQALDHLHKHDRVQQELTFKLVGELDHDHNGYFYLVVATKAETPKKIESLYKVYTNGIIREMWMEN